MSCYGCKESMDGYGLRTEGNLLFHTKCLNCVDCGKNLADHFDEIGSVKETRCLKCHRKKFPIKCYACRNVIDERNYRRIEQRPYHYGCFVCYECRRPFGEDQNLPMNQCFPVDGKFFCLKCHWGQRSTKYLHESVKVFKVAKQSGRSAQSTE